MFRPDADEERPATPAQRLAANLTALTVLADLDGTKRAATTDEQRALARWTGWTGLRHALRSDTAEATRIRAQLGDTQWRLACHAADTWMGADRDLATALWDTVVALGFDGGDVLSPDGAAALAALAPDHVHLTALETDPVTAAVTGHLYGARTDVVTDPLTTFDAAPERFDAALALVDSDASIPDDPRHNAAGLTRPGYVLVKAMRFVRPGGLVAAVVPNTVLDTRNPAARHAIGALADLLGAVRLQGAAADLLVLRRRPEAADPSGPAWRHTVAIDDGSELNEYLAAHPSHVIAAEAGPSPRRGRPASGGIPAERLAEVLQRIVTDVMRRGALYVPRPRARPAATSALPAHVEQGSFVLDPSGTISRVTGATTTRHKPAHACDLHELHRLIRLRDAACDVLAVQLADRPDSDLVAAQRTLTVRYDDYRRHHGALNRFTVARTGRTDPDTGEPVLRRVHPRMGGFRDDPHWPLVASLEIFDDEQQTAEPAPIFDQRILYPPVRRLGVDTAAEAIAVCLDETGRISVDRVAELLGVDTDRARAALDPHVYDDPGTGDLLPAQQYLTGDVRAKLAAARAAAARDPRYRRHVAALESAVPPPLPPDAITAQLGAPWIPEGDVEAFAAEVLGATITVEHVPALGCWFLRRRAHSYDTVALTSAWGTARADALALLDDALNQRDTAVYDKSADGSKVRNTAETFAASEKRDALNDRFVAWVNEDPARAERVADRYNTLFNSVVHPDYDGAYLTLPGLAASFTPRPHQRAAVARILTEGRALLAHVVGAGKTAVMAMAATELRRLARAAKPAVVVPNHMVDQVVREWLQLYPTARLLVADRDRLSRARRCEFVTRCASGSWDAVIFTQTSFAALGLSRLQYRACLDVEVQRLTDAIERSASGKALAVSRLEGRRERLQARVGRIAASRGDDDHTHFDHCGIDYLFVDEAHLFKNRRVDSATRELARLGSQRAQDLDTKLVYLRRRHARPGVATLSTATPVANSIAEMWVMQTFLQPDVLETAGVGPFDAWVAAFGRTVTRLELAPDGASYRLKTRFARFHNVPELHALFRQVADVRTAAMLDLPAPRIAGGKPQVVVVPPSDGLRAYVATLAERAEATRRREVHPSQDNMLKVCTDGRLAALDLRLVGLDPDPAGGKLAAVAAEVAARYHAHRNDVYLDGRGRPEPRPGSLQLVFCDLSTPSTTRWHAYGELRRQLAARGVPATAVRFIHDATTDQAKAALFAACRDGRVAVLLGSTSKMGVGTNVQRRCVAVHQVDCPWRPADIEQRDGRGRRQGNANDEIDLVRYVVEGSFDIYSWQTTEYKAVFIEQVLSGRTDREVDDVGDTALSYAEVKALATGNPLIVEKAAIDNEVARVVRLARAHDDDQRRLAAAATRADAALATAEPRLAALLATLTRRCNTSGSHFTMHVGDTQHTARADAGTALLAAGLAQLDATAPHAPVANDVATLGGLAIRLTTSRCDDRVTVTVVDTPIALDHTRDAWTDRDPLGVVQSLERRIAGLDTDRDQLAATVDHLRRERDLANARLGVPFESAALLAELRARQRTVHARLATDEALTVSA